MPVREYDHFSPGSPVRALARPVASSSFAGQTRSGFVMKCDSRPG